MKLFTIFKLRTKLLFLITLLLFSIYNLLLVSIYRGLKPSYISIQKQITTIPMLSKLQLVIEFCSSF